MADFQVPGQYDYKGMTMSGTNAPEVLDRVSGFEFRSSDVMIATYPKAGTTWLQEIIWLIMNNADVETSRKIPVNARWEFMETARSKADQAGIDRLPHIESQRYIRTRLPYRFYKEAIEDPEKPKFKTVVGVRNVRDLLVSFYHFHRMNKVLGNFDGSFDDFFTLFKEKKLIYGDYFDHVLSWWQARNNPNIYIARYENLKKDPKCEFQKLAAFLGNKLTNEQLDIIVKETSFETMQRNPMTNGERNPAFKNHISTLIRKGEVGDWQNYFTEEQLRYVNERCEKVLDPAELKFDYI